MSPRRLRADRRAGLLLAGVVVLAFVSLGATVALPVTDPALEQTSEAERALGELERRGMEVYRAEGCWYCHTQQVRDATADTLLGEPLDPGDYADRDPAMLGQWRIGPDLTHVGARYDSAAEILSVLVDPRARRHRSAMPSYVYLSQDDLQALSAYLLAQR